VFVFVVVVLVVIPEGDLLLPLSLFASRYPKALALVSPALKKRFCLRARLQPCCNCFARKAALAAEVRFFPEALLQQPL
jgi:hypothetical protein